MQSAQFQLHADIEERHWWFVGRRRIMREVVQRLVPAGDGKTVVDVGCGTGANIASLADDYRTVGIDTSAEAIDHARRRFPKVKFICGLAPDDLNGIAGQACLYCLMDVLEHVPDDFLLLSRLLAASTPGCQFLITVPADQRLWSQHDESFGHYRRYDLKRLVRVWEGLPVTTRMASYFNSRLYPAVRAIRTLNRWRGRASGPAGTDLALPAGAINRALSGLFAGESKVLLDLLGSRRSAGYRAGVSLMAVIRREEGQIIPRTRPTDVPADAYGPR
jgi:SAM-dependent methyltransferase